MEEMDSRVETLHHLQGEVLMMDRLPRLHEPSRLDRQHLPLGDDPDCVRLWQHKRRWRHLFLWLTKQDRQSGGAPPATMLGLFIRHRGEGRRG